MCILWPSIATIVRVLHLHLHLHLLAAALTKNPVAAVERRHSCEGECVRQNVREEQHLKMKKPFCRSGEREKEDKKERKKETLGEISHEEKFQIS